MVNLEGSTGPWKVVQALREQSGISTPIRATLWIHALVNTPSPSSSSTRTGPVAIWTRPAWSQGSAKQIARFAAADANEPVAALAALVDRVIDECFAALKCLAHRC